MNRTKRIITAKGPLQLLNVLSVLQFQRTKKEYQNTKDILIIAGSGDDETRNKLFEVCLQISGIWNFDKVINSLYLEKQFAAGFVSFTKAVKLIRKKLDIKSADVVYTCRRWQFFNELFLAAYPKARKINYGDGLGALDLNGSAWNAEPLNPSGSFIEMDDAYLIAPAEAESGAFKNYRITQVDFKFFSSVVKNSSKKIQRLRKYCKEIEQKLSQPITIVLPSNGISSGLYKHPENEINAYISRILPFTTPGESILVKGHPRERTDQPQAKRLTSKLNKLGRKAIDVKNFKEVPIELFVPFLSIKKAITLHSSSCIPLAYMCQKNLKLLIGLGKKGKQYLSNEWKFRFLLGEYSLSLLTQQALNKKFEPISSPAIANDIKNGVRKLHEQPKYFINGKSVTSPLTNESNITLLKTIKTEKLIRKWKIMFDIDIAKEFHEHDEIYLFECNQTNLKFFYPFDIAGSDNLYKQLKEINRHYQPRKIEYQKAFRHIKRGAKVLEVNGKVNKKRSNYYDVVCSFQKIQRISNVRDFLESQIHSLKKGGKLIFSVPNNDSYLAFAKDLLDMPPNHVNLWNKAAIKNLETIFKIKLINIYFEPLKNFASNNYFKSVIHSVINKELKDKRLKFVHNVISYYFPSFSNLIAHLASKRLKAFTIQAVFEKI